MTMIPLRDAVSASCYSVSTDELSGWLEVPNESLAWFIGLKGMHYGWPQEEI